jgi:hypothetical protein
MIVNPFQYNKSVHEGLCSARAAKRVESKAIDDIEREHSLLPPVSSYPRERGGLEEGTFTERLN